MSESFRRVGAITMFVEDPQRSKTFYGRVLETSPVYEDENALAFEFENTVVNLLRTPEADALIEPAAVATADTGSAFADSDGHI